MAGIDHAHLPARAEVEFVLQQGEALQQWQRIGGAVEFDDKHGTAGGLRGDGELDEVAQSIATRATGGQCGDRLGLAMQRFRIERGIFIVVENDIRREVLRFYLT